MALFHSVSDRDEREQVRTQHARTEIAPSDCALHAAPDPPPRRWAAPGRPDGLGVRSVRGTHDLDPDSEMLAGSAAAALDSRGHGVRGFNRLPRLLRGPAPRSEAPSQAPSQAPPAGQHTPV